MDFLQNIDKKRWLYNGLIITFIVLYAATAFVSFYHAITFFNIANAVWLSVLLSFVAEIGQASVLFSILLTENKNKFLPWIIMVILTSLQVIGNVVSSYDWIVAHNSAGVDGFQKSILFWVQTGDPEMFKVIIAWISGALLPIIALSMTALVAQNMNLRDEQKSKEETPETDKNSEQNINAKDIMAEISKIRPTEDDLQKLKTILRTKTQKTKEDIIEEIKTDVDQTPNKSSNNPDLSLDQEHFDEPEETVEPNEDEFGPVDLTNIEPDVLPSYIDEVKEEVPVETEKVEILPDIKILSNNGLIENVEVEQEKITEQTPKIDETPPIIEPEKKIQETPEPSPHSEQLTQEQKLERIRQIARDNLKKK